MRVIRHNQSCIVLICLGEVVASKTPEPTEEPGTLATVSPDAVGTLAPVELATLAPVELATVAPVELATVAPLPEVELVTVAPVELPSLAPLPAVSLPTVAPAAASAEGSRGWLVEVVVLDGSSRGGGCKQGIGMF